MEFNASPYSLKIVGSSSMIGGESFDWYDLDEAFQSSGHLPDLNGAPIASWVLARLRRLIPAIPAWSDEQNDGGGFCFDFDVQKDGELVPASSYRATPSLR